MESFSLIEPLESRIAPATLTIANVYVNEGNSGSSTLEFKVILDAPATQETVLHYSTADLTPDQAGLTGCGAAVVGADYTATSGDLTFALGESEKTFTVAVLGDVTAEANELLKVSISDPVSNTVLGTAQGTIKNDDHIVISGTTFTEGDTGGNALVTFTVTLPSAPATELSLLYSTSDIADAGILKATAGVDYTATSGTLTFAPGETQKTFTVPIKGDTTAEGDEIFQITLKDSKGALFHQTTAKILNDEAEITISEPTIVEGNSGTTNAVFTFTLNAAQTFPVSFHYQTADGTALKGSDYTETSGTVDFAAGELTKTVVVPITGDEVHEGNETFKLQLTQATQAKFKQGTTTASSLTLTEQILNDESTLSYESVKIAESNSGKNLVQVTFKLDQPFAQDMDFKFSTVGGGVNAAVADTDFTKVLNQSVTIPKGATSKTITVEVLGDGTIEKHETFTLSVTDLPAGVTLGATPTITILNDDFAIAPDYKSFQYTDLDGDLVLVKSSRPILTQGFVSACFQFVADESSDPEVQFQLDQVSFAGIPWVANSSLDISVLPGGSGDGKVNVGAMYFTTDMGTIRVAGGLGSIFVGDNKPTTQAIALLDVQSLGSVGENNYSLITGPSGTLRIRGGLTGTLSCADAGNVAGSGSISKLLIDGVLRGGETEWSGAVEASGKIGTVTVGSIFGGSGDFSGRIQAHSSIGSIIVDGNVVGGAGGGSGSIHASSISTLAIGKLEGGSGAYSGQVAVAKALTTATIISITGGSGDMSGTVLGSYHEVAKLGSLRVLFSITGGTGFTSGSVLAPVISSLQVNGDVIGHSGIASGTIQAGLSLGRTTIQGNLEGGSAHSSGGILAPKIASVTVNGDVMGGSGLSSGFIFASEELSYLKIHGSLRGGTAGLDAIQPNSNANPPVQGQSAVDGLSGSVRAKKIGTVIVDGSILGGTGTGASHSARLSGAILSETSIASLTVGMSVIGGGGAASGHIQAGTSFGKITIGGNLQGAAGDASGWIGANSASGTLQIGGSILGGAGDVSGKIAVSRGIQSITVGGDLRGGSGEGSGMIDARELGAIASLLVKGSLIGGSQEGAGSLAAASFGRISIGGDLVGGEGARTGFIFSKSTINSLAIGGAVTGGSGESSGSVLTNKARIGQVTVGLGITGGAGTGSGFINSDSIGTVTVGGIVQGGLGTNSGSIHSDATAITSLSIGGLQGGNGAGSGTIAGKGLGSARILGDVMGGDGENSGRISSIGGDIKQISIANLRGGTGDGSGALITNGILSKALISGDIVGGNAAAGQNLEKSGYVQARQIASLTVVGSIKAGLNAGADEQTRLVDSGTVRATEDILFLSAGNLVGSATNRVIISAQGAMDLPAGATTNVAIKNLSVRGNVSNAEILAGYGLIASNATPERGTPLNADAQIGKVLVSGTWQSSSLVAGLVTGADGVFGTVDDAVISGEDVYDLEDIFSKISSIIVSGGGSGGAAGEHYGIVAEQVAAARFNGVAVPLVAGTSNDNNAGAGWKIGGDSTFRVLEV